MSSETIYPLDSEDAFLAHNLSAEIQQFARQMSVARDLNSLSHFMDEISQTVTTFGLVLSDKYYDEISAIRAEQMTEPSKPTPPSTPTEPAPEAA